MLGQRPSIDRRYRITNTKPRAPRNRTLYNMIDDPTPFLLIEEHVQAKGHAWMVTCEYNRLERPMRSSAASFMYWLRWLQGGIELGLCITASTLRLLGRPDCSVPPSSCAQYSITTRQAEGT